MTDIARVELPLRAPSRVLSRCKTIKDLRETYPSIRFVKYTYLDPEDKKLRGANPPNDLPLLKDSYITVSGNMTEIIKFSEDATEE